MTQEHVNTAIRVGIVIFYTMLAESLCHDGTSAGELTALTLLAIIAIVTIVALDWITAATRRGDR